MTLEDFFTLTEMKNGLTTLARVGELISVMQNQKVWAVSNGGDVARQCSTCSGTLLATENKDCLNHFVELNGLCFLNQWLKEALKCANDSSDSTIEDLVSVILRSLERLPVDRENPSASEICTTIEQLLNYKSQVIKDQARTLLEKWNNAIVCDVNGQNLENKAISQGNQETPHDDANTSEDAYALSPVPDISPFKSGSHEGNYGVQSSGSNSHNPDAVGSPGNSQLNVTNDVKTSIIMPIVSTETTEVVDSFDSYEDEDTCQRNMKYSSVHLPDVRSSAGLCINPVGSGTVAYDFHEALDLRDGIRGIEVELNKGEGNEQVSHDLPSSLDPVIEPVVLCNADSQEAYTTKNEDHQPQSNDVDLKLSKNLKDIKDVKSVSNARNVVQDISGNVFELRNVDGSVITSPREETVESDGDSKDFQIAGPLKVREGQHHVFPIVSSRMVEKVSGELGRKSDMELEYGEIDALEVARQVAIEVEREVVDYREPFCSSSPEVNSGETMSNHKCDLVYDKKDQTLMKEKNRKELSTSNDLSDSKSNSIDDSYVISEKIDTSSEKTKLQYSSNLATVLQESNLKIDKKTCECDFDLNEDACTEELDLKPVTYNTNYLVNLLTPIAVAASKRTLELPISRPFFEGVMGWKGSATTSAFRPASPRRILDGEKTYSGPRQRTNILEIDLNIAETENNAQVDISYVKQMPYSGIHSENSSVEVSSRAEKLKLDLNRLGDEYVPLDPSNMHQKFQRKNEDQSLSSASSTYSRHPSVRDFDLNDNPSFLDGSGSHNASKLFSKAMGMSGGSIMGSSIAVERIDCNYQAAQPIFANEFSLKSYMSDRSVSPYAHVMPHAYGFNGHPSWPYPPALYEPTNTPYMLDSRTTVAPQMLGTTRLGGASSGVLPFLTSVAAPSSLNVFGSSESGLHLNPGATMIDSRRRDAGEFRQFLIPGQNGLMEAQTITALQPASSDATLKRKGPDNGWDPCKLGYKHVTTWK